MLVVLAHAGLRMAPGGMGVTIFFVISGFVITRLLIREYDQVPGFRIKAFFARRVLKIFPPLLVIVILPSIVLFQRLNLDGRAVFAQIFFFYNWIKLNQGAAGVLIGSAVVWSLAIEEQFYIAVAVLWSGLVRTAKPVASLFTVYSAIFLYSTLARVYVSLTNEAPHDATGNLPRIYYGTDCRISSIAIGGLLALAVARPNRLLTPRAHTLRNALMGKWAFFVGVGLIVVSLVVRNEAFRDTARYSLQELAAVLLIASSLNAQSWPSWVDLIASSRLVQTIGLASYTLYLTHLLVIGLIGNLHLSIMSGYLGITLLAIAATASGVGLHYVVDAPFEKYRARWRLQKDSEAQPRLAR